MENMRKESNLLGELNVPKDVYYGIKMQKVIDNFKISGQLLSSYPIFIMDLAYVKRSAAKTNYQLGLLDEVLNKNMVKFSDEITAGKLRDQFPIDIIQGGEGTSTNINVNEVIANRVLELPGHEKGDYQHCSASDVVNLSQSTNDFYPTSIKIALIAMNQKLVKKLEHIVKAFRAKGKKLNDVIYSSAMKFSKICNDLRLLLSGTRAELSEINLPPMQPGSSIMTGKLDQVIPEVVNKVCFKFIDNDLKVTFSAEAGKLQPTVLKPIFCHSIMESKLFLRNALGALRERCITGITANKKNCYEIVKNSIGIITALNPCITYQNAVKIAKGALKTGKSVYDLLLEYKILTQERLDEILDPKRMLNPEELIF